MKTKLLYSKNEIADRVKAAAEWVRGRYKASEEILCVCVLKGAVTFFAFLMEGLSEMNLIFDFITLSSYGSELVSKGYIKKISDTSEYINGRNILIIEDIVDSGVTLDYLKKHFADKGAARVDCVCLLDKPLARKTDIKPDFAAFTLEGEPFVVGYGMDYAGRYRNLDGIYTVSIAERKA